MSQAMRPLLLVLVVALAALLGGCQAQPPQPEGRPAQTDDGSSASPELPGAATPASGGPQRQSNAGALLEPVGQPLLPGLYLPEDVLARGSDHYTFIQSTLSCDGLRSIIAAGEWSIDERAQWPLPTPNPEEGIPELPGSEWLLLSMGSERAIARMGGAADSCAAQVWRVARQPYTATGAFEADGHASAVQLMCAASGGRAGFSAMFFGEDDLRYTLETEVPLELGSHPIEADTELTIGRSPLDLFALFQLFADPAGGADEEPGFEYFFPADENAEGWEGSVTVSSIEPLVGEISLENLRDEAGRAQTLRSGFRCDLPAGELDRAAAQARPSPGPDEPEPPPVAGPGSATVTIDSGRHAGSHQVSSTELSCALNLFSDGAWTVTYSDSAEPVAGRLQTLSLNVPEGGGRSGLMLIFGDDFELDWFNIERAAGEVADRGDAVDFDVRGTTAGGVAVEISVSCRDVARF